MVKAVEPLTVPVTFNDGSEPDVVYFVLQESVLVVTVALFGSHFEVVAGKVKPSNEHVVETLQLLS